MLRRIPIILTLMIALLPRVGHGGINEDLERLRAAFEEEIAETGEPQLRLYLAQLEALERALAAEGNYAGAIQTRNEAEAVRREIADLDAGLPDDPNTGTEGEATQKIILLPEAAATAGVVWDQTSGSLHGWRSSKDVARWQLPNLPPGGYEVVLEDLAGPSEGGDFVISEAFFRLTGQIEPTDGETVKKNFGTLKIRSGQAFLSLFATRIESGGLMRLKSIELIPAWR